MAYPATPKTWVAGDVLTAAQLNAELRDALLGAFPLGPPDGAWTSFVPTVKFAATAATIVSDCKYTRVGRLIVANYAFRLTVLGGGVGNMSITYPVARRAITDPANAYINSIGTGGAIDLSAPANIYWFFARNNDNASFIFGTPAVPQVSVTNTAPITWAAGASGTGDEFYATITYESAT